MASMEKQGEMFVSPSCNKALWLGNHRALFSEKASMAFLQKGRGHSY